MEPAVAPLSISFLLVFSLSMGAAPKAALTPGEKAPDFELRTRRGQMVRYDASVTSPALFLSVKPAERYTSQTLSALNETFEKFPQLGNGLFRWIVVSRIEGEDETLFHNGEWTEGWGVLLDPDDTFYKDYRIIATPTITVVGEDHVVVAVHPGYDTGMVQHVRIALAKLLGVELPQTVTQKAEKPNFNLQLARRMAQRGLWDKALMYFEKAMEQGPLPPEALLELAESQIEVGQAKEALETLDSIPDGSVDPSRIESLKSRAQKLDTRDQEPNQPPKIFR